MKPFHHHFLGGDRSTIFTTSIHQHHLHTSLSLSLSLSLTHTHSLSFSLLCFLSTAITYSLSLSLSLSLPLFLSFFSLFFLPLSFTLSFTLSVSLFLLLFLFLSFFLCAYVYTPLRPSLYLFFPLFPDFISLSLSLSLPPFLSRTHTLYLTIILSFHSLSPILFF